MSSVNAKCAASGSGANANGSNGEDTQSTNTALGDLIRDFDIDGLEVANGQNNVHTYHTLQTIAQQENPGDFDFVLQLIQAEQEPDNAEGDAIMANLTGFGLTSSLGMAGPGPQMHAVNVPSANAINADKIYVQILEEPAENKLRFRYECEGRSAGALQGERSTNETKTFPTLQIVGYSGPAVCVVSLVEHNPPYRAHPHNLVGKDGLCKQGVCSVEISRPDMTYAFQNLGIQCVRKRDAPASLDRRHKIRVDPFKQGFDHKNASIDLNIVRLCFQVFLKTPTGLVPLKPVVSKIVKDRKAHCDLQIVDYSDDCSPVEGGKKILLFCDKITRDDIEVHFTQYTKGGETIVAKGEFSVNDVHKQYGISLRTPRYINMDITEPVLCSMSLFKPKSQSISEPVDFWYLPSVQNQDGKAGFGSPANLKQIMKQARQRQKASRDEPSSGQITVPPKMTPSQLHTGGGQVTVVANVSPVANAAVSSSAGVAMALPEPGSPRYQLQQYLMASSPADAQKVFNGQRSPQQVGVGRVSPYEQVALDHKGGGLVMQPTHNITTQELQNLLAGTDAGFPFPGSQGGSQMPEAPNVATFMGPNHGMAVQNNDSLANISLGQDDLAVGDIENISYNLDSSLHIGRQSELNELVVSAQSAHAQTGAAQPGAGGYKPQMALLSTPEVSSASMETPSARKNNLNK